jgi:F-type H+-transporting ATPase subunit gamma
MCGQFNERMLEFLRQQENKWRYQPADILYWSVGERIRSGLLNDARSIDEHFDLPGSPAGIHNLVQQLLQTLESYQRSRGVETFYILFNHIKSSVAFEPTALRLLPLDESWVGYVTSQPQTGRCIPRLGLPWETLFRHLFSQYIFVSFYCSLAQSLASENAARFQSMQAAEKNILEMTDNLQQKFRETRQNNITSELLDIVSGFEAMRNP